MTSENRIPDYTIRQCQTLDEFTACINLQREVWQFADLDITPLRSFVITLHSGGMTFGAFDRGGKLLGFSHALAAFDEQNRPYYYSHMAAVDHRLRNSGIGVKLKLAQRDMALKRGIPLIKWTFDPLQSRNAYLNIVKLGGVVRTYLVNYYGNASTSELHRGLDTDRLFVEWWVGSERVTQALAGQRREQSPIATVEIPAEIQDIKSRDLAEARRWQSEARAAFQRCLTEGLYCAGFERGRDDAPSRYLFFKDEHIEEERDHK